MWGAAALPCAALDLSPPFSYLFGPTIDPGPSGEDSDIGSGNLAMSDHRVRRRCASGPVDVAGHVIQSTFPRHHRPAPSVQHGANERSEVCENAKSARRGYGEASGAADRAIDRSTAGEAANNHPVAAPARAPVGPGSCRRAVHRWRLPQHPPHLRDLDAAARADAAGGGYPAVASGARSVPGLDRAASPPLVRRPRCSQQNAAVDTVFII